MAEDESKPWMIRDVPEKTRRDVKTYAARNGLTIAEALVELVNLGLGHADAATITPVTEKGMAERIVQQIQELLESGGYGAIELTVQDDVDEEGQEDE